MNDQAEKRVGSVINGKWRVDSLIDSGSMASVYAATHRNGARAALKMLHPALCVDPAVCERFLGEGYLTNSVKHEGIVRIFDDGMTDDGCVFLVMDLLEGVTLEGLRMERGGQIAVREVLGIADKLMGALAAVHDADLIHRDLKPQNVFICRDGSVKLLDFGIAKVRDQAAMSKVSVFGLVLGSPSFMSPEQALGERERVDQRSDVWSLGATLFTALTGQTVHLGPSAQAKMLSAATAEARSILIVMPDLPKAIGSAIDTSLRFKQDARWQTVADFRRALMEGRAQLDAAPVSSVVESVDVPIELAEFELAEVELPSLERTFEVSNVGAGDDEPRFTSRRSRRRGVWLVAAAVAAVCAGGAVLLSSTPSDRWQTSKPVPREAPLVALASAQPSLQPALAEAPPASVVVAAVQPSSPAPAVVTPTLPPPARPRPSHARPRPPASVASAALAEDPFTTPE